MRARRPNCCKTARRRRGGALPRRARPKPSRYHCFGQRIDAATICGQSCGGQARKLKVTIRAQRDVATVIERDDAAGVVRSELATDVDRLVPILFGSKCPRLFQPRRRRAGNQADLRRGELRRRRAAENELNRLGN